jgi:hypothetical protein
MEDKREMEQERRGEDKRERAQKRRREDKREREQERRREHAHLHNVLVAPLAGCQ